MSGLLVMTCWTLNSIHFYHTITLLGEAVISYSDSFLRTTGMRRGSVNGRPARLFVTIMLPGREGIFGCSTTTNFLVFCS